jgi:glycosyltransferase 2 family protein
MIRGTEPAVDPPRSRQLARLALRILLSAVLLTALFTLLPWDQITAAASRMTLAVYATALAGFAAGHALGAVKWRTMLAASVGGSPISVRDTAGCYGAGLFFNLFLPTVVGGDVMRATLAARALGRTEAVVLGSVADRIIDFAALALLLGAGVLFAGADMVGWAGPLAGVAAIVVLGTGLLLAPLVVRRSIHRWPRRFRRRGARGMVALRRMARRPRAALLALTLAAAMQCAFILIGAWLGSVVGAHAPLWAWFVAWPVAKAAAMLPVSLGGLGVRDAALAAMLVPFGVPAAYGVVASLAWNAVLIGGALLGGLLAWAIRPGRHRMRGVGRSSLSHMSITST